MKANMCAKSLVFGRSDSVRLSHHVTIPQHTHAKSATYLYQCLKKVLPRLLLLFAYNYS